MADLASTPDVEAHLGRPVRGGEQITTPTWLRAASAVLRTEIPTVDDLVAEDTDYADRVRAVVAMAVVRMLRGQDRTDPADYATIFFTKSELASLSPGLAGSVSSAVLVTAGWEDDL